MKKVTFVSLFLVLAVIKVSGDVTSQPPHHGDNNDGKHENRPLKYIIELSSKDSFVRHCGATQLNAEWFLTAAECVNLTKYDSTLLLGLDWDHHIRRISMMWVEERVHPEYNEKTNENNIALVRYYPSKYGADSLRLPSTSSELETAWDKFVFISGWSNWPEAESLTTNNMVTKITNPLWCQLLYFFQFNKGKHLCVSSVPGYLSQDNVGAKLLVFDTDNVMKIIGIATNIRPFTDAFPMPMVFTKVQPYVEWILKETNGLKQK